MAFKVKCYPTQDFLRDLFEYDTITGNLIYRKTVNNRKGGRKGETAGSIRSSTLYRVICINYQHYVQHRLTYILHYGDIPEGYQIDHMDNDRSNNKIENLKAIPYKENHMKKKIPSNNTSGYIGVSFNKRKRKWDSQINLNGKHIHLGSFNTPEEANVARQKANPKYGFHPTHGKERSIKLSKKTLDTLPST